METIKTYVEYLYPGSFFSEEEVHEVKSRDIKSILKKLPKKVFCFSFYDQSSKEVKIDGETEIVFGKRKNVSGKYYPDAEIYNLKQIKAMGKDHDILASNMECNDWPYVVKTRMGNFQPFEDKDKVV